MLTEEETHAQTFFVIWKTLKLNNFPSHRCHHLHIVNSKLNPFKSGGSFQLNISSCYQATRFDQQIEHEEEKLRGQDARGKMYQCGLEGFLRPFVFPELLINNPYFIRLEPLQSTVVCGCRRLYGSSTYLYKVL